MRFNNSSLQKWVPIVYLFLFLGILLSILVYGVMRAENADDLFWYILPTGILLLLFLFIYKVVAYFEYDSDGLALNFVNRGLMLSNFLNYREKRAEFPREKLSRFKMNDFGIYRQLTIYVKSHSGREKKLKFNITFLSARKRRALRQSLEKVVAHNKVLDGGRK